MSEPALGPAAVRAAQAEPALAQAGDVLGRDGVLRQQAGGSNRSKMVRLAYITQPGRPHTGVPFR